MLPIISLESNNLLTVFQFISIGSTVFFTLKMILMLIGGDAEDGGDIDVDGDMDADHGEGTHTDSNASFTLVSIQSVLGFLMGFGWMGWAIVDYGYGGLVASGAALMVGMAFMLFTAFLAFQMKKLDREVKFDIYRGIGRSGRVYLTVPENGQGRGEVEVVIDNKKMILPAISAGDSIKSFTDIMVVNVEGDVLVVEPVKDTGAI